MQSKLGTMLNLKPFFLPEKNHWSERIALVFVFVIFDYLSTLVFCRFPSEEANLGARIFMENLGIPIGLTLFVLVANLPIYMTLALDSHVVRLTPKAAIFVEPFLEFIFAWFVAGLHFSGGTSWFWNAPVLTRQILGASLYLIAAFLIVKSHKLRRESEKLVSV
jgi:hypothetical protein